MPFKIKYRPDIDGLRALAVISVIVFHLKKSWLPSGFLGVDIFFVISGFLITSIIFPQIKNGTFSFSDFYNRRIKRILPVFFVVLIVTLVISGYLMHPSDLYGLRNATISSLLFAANLYFSRSLGYFDISSEERPFLHIWSLSVEEQYYFLFPIFLFFLLKFSYVRKHIFKFILGIFSILIAISFVNLTKIGIYLDTYYLPHLRFIEILTGSILAIFLIKYPQNHSKRVYVSLSSLSLFILIISFISENIFTPPHFPGILSLIPAIATAVFIFSNAENHFISKIFSNKILVWIGKLSYSLYLWHWVILALMRYIWQENELPLSWMVVAVILTFILSIFSYYFVENPIRKLTIPFKKSFVYFYILPAFLLMGMFYYIELNYKDTHKVDIISENLGDTTKPEKVLVIGDSHTLHLYPFIDAIGKKEGWNARMEGISGCAFMLNKRLSVLSKNYLPCKKRAFHFFKYYDKYDIVVISNHIGTLGSKHNILYFDNTLKELTSRGKKVYVVNSGGNLNVKVQRTAFLKDKFLMKYLIKEKIALLEGNKIVFKNRFIRRRESVKAVIQKYPSVKFIDLPSLSTQYVLKKYKLTDVYRDSNHLTEFGSALIADEFIRQGHTFIDKKDLENN